MTTHRHRFDDEYSQCWQCDLSYRDVYGWFGDDTDPPSPEIVIQCPTHRRHGPWLLITPTHAVYRFTTPDPKPDCQCRSCLWIAAEYAAWQEYLDQVDAGTDT